MFVSSFSLANSLSDAANIQKQSFDKEKKGLTIEEKKEHTKKVINSKLQSLFYQYYIEVKKSEVKLANAQREADELSAARRRSGSCCDILISSQHEGGMYVITTDGDGLFAIEGYGLQSVSGVIQDEKYEQNGTLSDRCTYQVSISYKNSRTYSCSEFMSGEIDKRVIKDMIEMLPVAMDSYH